MNSKSINQNEYIESPNPRSKEQKIVDFNHQKSFISGMIQELLCVNILEYHNNNWLFADEKVRSQSVAKTLRVISNAIDNLRR